MPGGIPEQLSDTAAALYGAIGSFISQGIGADRAYAILRDSDTYVPRAQVRQIASEIRTSLGYRADLARAVGGNVIPDRLVSTQSNLKTDNFVSTVSMLLRDKTTGYTFQQYYTYVSADLVSPDEIFDALDDESDTPGSWYEFDIVGATLMNVAHR